MKLLTHPGSAGVPPAFGTLMSISRFKKYHFVSDAGKMPALPGLTPYFISIVSLKLMALGCQPAFSNTFILISRQADAAVYFTIAVVTTTWEDGLPPGSAGILPASNAVNYGSVRISKYIIAFFEAGWKPALPGRLRSNV